MPETCSVFSSWAVLQHFKFLFIMYTVSQKGFHQTHGGITLSNLNRFSKFFYRWKESEISNKTHVSFFHHTLSMLSHYLGEFKSLNLSQIWTYKTTAKTHFCYLGAWCNAAKHLFHFAIPSTKFSQYSSL